MPKHEQLSERRAQEQEKLPQTPQSYGPALCVLGLIDAALGRKEEAAREGRRADRASSGGKGSN